MEARTDPAPLQRAPLSRERILRAAVDLADEQGLESLSMRRLGRVLGVQAMSLYNHVASKGDLLDGIADLVTSEFDVPSPGTGWKAAVRRCAISAHETLRRHPWASSLIESRVNNGPARLHYLDSLIGVFREAGFSMQTTLRAIMALDSHAYGFTLQEQAWSFDAQDAPAMAARFASRLPPGEYPHLVAMASMVASTPDGVPLDFEFGLDLILDGLDRIRDSA